MNKPELPRRLHVSFDDESLAALHRGIVQLRVKQPSANFQDALRSALVGAYPAPRKISAKRGRKG